MNTIRRGLKRKEPGQDPEAEEYQAGLNQFQAAVRKRESIRLKLQLSSAPGVIEKELRNKINIEESVCKGTAKFISACKNECQVLEAAKNLLLGNLRVDMLKFELNKIRRGRGSPAMKQGNPSYAAVSLSDVRIPLLWRPRDHMQDTGDSRRFAIFCIARVGAQIYDTGLVHPVDRNSTDVTFPDVLLFSKMPPYFELKLELYSYLLSDNSMVTTQAKIANSFSRANKSISKAVGKRLARTMREVNGVKEEEEDKSIKHKGPKFDLLGTATLRLDDAGEDVRSHELYMEETENDHPRLPPLFGQFCARLAVMPYCREEAVLVGGLGVKGEGITTWQEDCWVRLMDWKLSLWSGVEQYEQARSPTRCVKVDQETTIKDGGGSEGNTFTVENYGEGKVEFLCPTKESKVMWLAHLYQHACDQRRWRQAAVHKMEVLSPDTRPSLARSQGKTRSKLVLMYNETKI
eukprot:GFUD01106138.1.p1 GENE.GFUD01106138.1~~GFUD01106138.1.p1  ORF type:complete len:462 (+),score=154.09 GFUD01106138.1:110-1495(+)